MEKSDNKKSLAVEKYYQNPNICLHCNKVIEIGDKRICDTKVKKFCNKICFARHNNFKRKIAFTCKHCGAELSTKRKFCNSCLKKIKQSINKNNHLSFVSKLTKGELIKRRKNYQCFRSAIQRMARNIYRDSDNPKSCSICGYDKTYEVCHHKSVAQFSLDSKISEINDINNLIALCPNHHWEYDHNKLVLMPTGQMASR